MTVLPTLNYPISFKIKYIAQIWSLIGQVLKTSPLLEDIFVNGIIKHVQYGDRGINYQSSVLNSTTMI